MFMAHHVTEFEHVICSDSKALIKRGQRNKARLHFQLLKVLLLKAYPFEFKSKIWY